MIYELSSNSHRVLYMSANQRLPLEFKLPEQTLECRSMASMSRGIRRPHCRHFATPSSRDSSYSSLGFLATASSMASTSHPPLLGAQSTTVTPSAAVTEGDSD